MNTNSKYILFHINGTPEKNLIATCVINSLREVKPHKKIVIITHFPEIWLHNPDVYRVYKLGATPYFYEDFVVNTESEIYAHDPHLTSDYINQKKSLQEIWCDMLHIAYNNSAPQLYFTQREKEVAQKIIQTGKPILLIHGNDTFSTPLHIPFNWTKDIPIDVLQDIAHVAFQKGYDVLQIRNQNHPAINGATTLTLSLRLTLAALTYIDKILTIDSFTHHACAALNKSAVVTWLSALPHIESYSIHTNISAYITPTIQERLDEYSPFFDVNGEHIAQPALMEDVYSAEKIVTALDL